MSADNLAHKLAKGIRDALTDLKFWEDGTEYHVGRLGPLLRFDRRRTDFSGTVHLRLEENGKRYRITIKVYEDREQHIEEEQV